MNHGCWRASFADSLFAGFTYRHSFINAFISGLCFFQSRSRKGIDWPEPIQELYGNHTYHIYSCKVLSVYRQCIVHRALCQRPTCLSLGPPWYSFDRFQGRCSRGSHISGTYRLYHCLTWDAKGRNHRVWLLDILQPHLHPVVPLMHFEFSCHCG